MIDYLDPKEIACFEQANGEIEIGEAWGRQPRGMVVGNDHRRSSSSGYAGANVPKLDAIPPRRDKCDHIQTEDTPIDTQADCDHHFPSEAAEKVNEVIARVLRTADLLARQDALYGDDHHDQPDAADAIAV